VVISRGFMGQFAPRTLRQYTARFWWDFERRTTE